MIKRLITALLLTSPLFVSTQQIGELTLMFNDSARHRPLKTEIWYPTTDNRKPDNIPGYPFIHIPTIRQATLPAGKHPLILISHGTGGGRMTLEWLADALVQKGFIVAAVDHWGNTYDNKIAIDFVTPWERPQDISFVLTKLLDDQKIGPVIDRNKIGAAGFSIGGYTVIALAGGKISLDALDKFGDTKEGVKEFTLPEFPGLDKAYNHAEAEASFERSPDLKDKRIKAFFVMCPAVGQGFTQKEQLSRVTDPLYIVGAQSDSIAPVETNALHYHQLIPRSKLYVVPGKAGHYTFLNEGTEAAKQNAGPFLNDDPSVNRHAIHEKVARIAVEFFQSALK
ncbi:MAG: dienelactone hydrolase [Bacteroidetes bacterium]|nr:dienelactone hydrolase [Bacteroidota bacterium]